MNEMRDLGLDKILMGRARGPVLAFVLMAGWGCALAQGTKLWTVGRYDEMERGSTEGVAIRSDGSLEASTAPALVYTAEGNYVWAVAGDAAGNAYVGLGGTTSGGAAVMRVGADGKAVKVFSGTELAVQALRVAGDGSLLVATSPDGKVYRVGKDGGAPVVVFNPAETAEKSKYLWDLAVGVGGEVYVAAGAPAAVYRVAAGKKAELVFKTADQHVRCLLLSRSGMLWAGTDGGGVVYRVDPKTVGAKPFAMLAAMQREITSLAEDEAGNVYAAGVGSKTGTSLPPLSVTGAVGVTITFVQPSSTGAVSGSALVPDGSEIYRIGVDGAPSRLVVLKEDVVYGLVVRDGALMASTGNRGRVYRLDLGVAGRFADAAHLEASQGTAMSAAGGGLLVGTSNSGKVYRIGAAGGKAVYTSEVFDAGGFSRWGRLEVRGEGTGYGLFVRVGNVPSPVEGWSEWVRVEGGAGKIPAGRFAQWKAELMPGTTIDQVAVNYLPRNAAPVVDDVMVQLGARVAPGGAMQAQPTLQVSFPAAAPPVGFVLPVNDPNAGPLTAQKDKAAATVRWLAHDDNGDDLMFAVWYRGVGEKNFRLLKDKISDRFYSFDLGAVPDGAYVLKIVASDGPSHADVETMTGERESGAVVVDTTAPVVSGLKAMRGAKGIEVAFEAADATSPLAHAEYSLDAGAWQYVEPEGKVSDGLRESYRVTVPLAREAAGEHVVAVRVYDRYENVGSEKVVVR